MQSKGTSIQERGLSARLACRLGLGLATVATLAMLTQVSAFATEANEDALTANVQALDMEVASDQPSPESSPDPVAPAPADSAGTSLEETPEPGVEDDASQMDELSDAEGADTQELPAGEISESADDGEPSDGTGEEPDGQAGTELPEASVDPVGETTENPDEEPTATQDVDSAEEDENGDSAVEEPSATDGDVARAEKEEVAAPQARAATTTSASATSATETAAATAASHVASLKAESDGTNPLLVRKGKEYYWYNADGDLVKNQLVKVTHSTSGTKLADSNVFWAYARPNGMLVRGSWSNGTNVYLADAKGHLYKRNGWLEVKVAGDTAKRRYYMSDYAAQTGFFEVGSGRYYGTAKQGYVVRGVKKTYEGWLAANSRTGKLATSSFVTTDVITGKKNSFWFGKDSKLVTARFITPKKDGTSAYYYARDDGSIVRGLWTNEDGRVLLADKTGKLATKSGWLVTKKYAGSLERYRVVNHAALTGFFQVGKSWYYGIADEGHVARGTTKTGDGWVIANARTGKLVTSQWRVTSKFTGEQDRFWFGSNGQMARDRLIRPSEGAGYFAYAKPNGAVVRGAYYAGDGVGYVANIGTGKLMGGKSGWIITGAYDNGIKHRYRYVAKTHSVRMGGFTVGKNLYYGFPTTGYVAIGKTALSDGVLLADSAGRLEKTTGWLVTSKYDNAKQRYYMRTSEKRGVPMAQIRVFDVKSGKRTARYYGDVDYGFVKRNCIVYSGTNIYRADNTGKLTSKGKMSGIRLAAYKHAQDIPSDTDWLITLERRTHMFYLWRRDAKGWNLEWDSMCSIGRPQDGHYSMTGVSRSKVYERLSRFHSTIWALGFNHVLHIHSVIVNGNNQVTDGRLGMNISAGCVRLPVDRAYAAYLRVPIGTTVDVYDIISNH